MDISFYAHEIDFELQEQELVKDWLLFLVRNEGQTLQDLSYIFVSDDYLLGLNREHLQHDYYTDILTFPYHTEGNPIIGEIYISVDRVADNANTFSVSADDELQRVMAHGVLHLMGYDDHEEADIVLMRKKEQSALEAWNQKSF